MDPLQKAKGALVRYCTTAVRYVLHRNHMSIIGKGRPTKLQQQAVSDPPRSQEVARQDSRASAVIVVVVVPSELLLAVAASGRAAAARASICHRSATTRYHCRFFQRWQISRCLSWGETENKQKGVTGGEEEVHIPCWGTAGRKGRAPGCSWRKNTFTCLRINKNVRARSRSQTPHQATRAQPYAGGPILPNLQASGTDPQ